MLAFFAGEVQANAMPQIQLPIFPASSTAFTSELAFEQRDGQVYYFNGHFPVFTHLLDEGMEVPAIGQRLGVFPNTLHQAISYNR